jgi:hypothetical protein
MAETNGTPAGRPRASYVNRGHIEDTWFVDEAISGNSAPIARGGNASVTDNGNRALSIIAVVLAAGAVGAMFLMPLYTDARIHTAEDTAQKAEREAKLLREDVRVMSIALAAHGIDTDEHGTEKRK